MEDTTEVREVLKRLKLAAGVKSKTDLAKALGLSQQSIFNAQAKGKIPDGWIRKIAKEYGVSADWLFFGDGQMRRGTNITNTSSKVDALNKEILKNVIEVLEEYLEEEGNELSPEAKADVISELYKLIAEDESSLTQPFRMLRIIRGALAPTG